MVPRPGFEPGRTDEGPADFLTRYGFRRRAACKLRVRGLERAFTVARSSRELPTLGARRPLSTPSAPQSHRAAWLGVASQPEPQGVHRI